MALGGGIDRIPEVGSEIDHRVHADTVDRTTRQLTVRATLLGDESPTVGLATGVTSQVFSAAKVDALVEQPRTATVSDRQEGQQR